MNEQTIQPRDDRLLTPRELAERWGVSLLALRKRRSQAPAYNAQLRGYMLSDVLAFEQGGLIHRQELAKRWGIGIRALEKREEDGRAPRRVKVGGRSYYRLNDIVDFERNTNLNASDEK